MPREPSATAGLLSSEAEEQQDARGLDAAAATPRADMRKGRPAVNSPRARALGRAAQGPLQIPWAGWKMVLRRTLAEMISDRIGLAAAGCAFYATLALFPTISMLVSVYGLAFDPATVEPQLRVLRHLLPTPAYALISERVHTLVSQPRGTLTINLIISIMVTLWSSSAGTKSMLAALNIAYEEKETRSFVAFQATALTMTFAAILGAALTVALLVFLPAVLDFIPLHFGFQAVAAQTERLIRIGSPLVMVLFVACAFSLLYRFGPSRRGARWHWVTPGSVIATVLWLIASAAFSYYVGHVASYDATYGPLGAVVGVMMWFFVTAYVVLLGAELNAELEMQTAMDSTAGRPRPIGRRGAYVADHVADE
ncbi:YihY/virulence factor BrkB family protein [Rhizosaccharibacter radicis]|uniref:YihY/virulence factor BrkB family protein n=1 Tax=Rhizosaccharibacter radicis TaxID=2782605 RepID=A0ABT1W050_9PROT|nr:YihY/virulence factor BrkB family protein [Acetobacteraceae bacterium KSS12]